MPTSSSPPVNKGAESEAAAAAAVSSSSDATATAAGVTGTAATHTRGWEKSDAHSSRCSSVHSASTTEDDAREPLVATKPRATPPTTREELDEQLTYILYATGTLQSLQARGKYIAEREVASLRQAFRFTVSEAARVRAPIDRQDSPADALDSAKDSSSTQSRPFDGASDSSATTTPHGVPPSPFVQSRRGRRRGKAAGGSPTTPYADIPKAAAVERMLTELEAYVLAKPASATYEGTTYATRLVNWRSVFHTPGERRKQSIMVSVFIFFTGIPISLLVLSLFFLSRYTAWMGVLYLLYIFTLGKVRHPIKRNLFVCRGRIWRYYRDYFPVRLVVPKVVRRKFDSSKNYLFAYHPHGVHTFGAIINFGLDSNDLTTLLPGIHPHLQTLPINFVVPFWRRLMIWMGCGDASAATIRATLRNGPGESVVLVVGGAEESIMAQPHTNNLFLVRRKGFVKIALQEGSPLVPVYGFGENNVYKVPAFASYPRVKRVMRVLKHYLGFAPLLISGRGFFTFNMGLMPHRSPIVVVVGEPLDMPKIPNPTADDLEFWQHQYILALEKLYEEHRGIYDLESTGLRIMN